MCAHGWLTTLGRDIGVPLFAMLCHQTVYNNQANEANITGDRLIADTTSIVLWFGRRIMSSTLQNKLIYPFKSGM